MERSFFNCLICDCTYCDIVKGKRKEKKGKEAKSRQEGQEGQERRK
jgi:hypothetical protein